MRVSLKKPLKEKTIVVDLKLQDDSIVERIAVDTNGEIMGKVIGGHDGLDESPLPFRQEDIIAYRRRGLAAKIGMAKWHNAL